MFKWLLNNALKDRLGLRVVQPLGFLTLLYLRAAFYHPFALLIFPFKKSKNIVFLYHEDR